MKMEKLEKDWKGILSENQIGKHKKSLTNIKYSKCFKDNLTLTSNHTTYPISKFIKSISLANLHLTCLLIIISESIKDPFH